MSTLIYIRTARKYFISSLAVLFDSLFGILLRQTHAAPRGLHSLKRKSGLPGSLLNTRDLALVSQFTEANTADAIFSQN
jgi:hypothetical protein